MVFDYSAGGLIPNPDKRTLLSPIKKQNMTANAFSAQAVSDNGKIKGISARWYKDRGPIGQAIRNGKIDILRAAINKVRRT